MEIYIYHLIFNFDKLCDKRKQYLSKILPTSIQTPISDEVEISKYKMLDIELIDNIKREYIPKEKIKEEPQPSNSSPNGLFKKYGRIRRRNL